MPKAKTRHRSAEKELRIQEEADACEHLSVAPLVQREGIYTSYLSCLGRERKSGGLQGLSGNEGGSKLEVDRARAETKKQLRGENKRIKERLAQAETIIGVQKRVSQMLGLGPIVTENRDTWSG